MRPEVQGAVMVTGVVALMVLMPPSVAVTMAV